MTLAEFTKDCLDNQDIIVVRERINGKWGSYALAELPDNLKLAWINGWYAEGRSPIKLMEGF